MGPYLIKSNWFCEHLSVRESFFYATVFYRPLCGRPAGTPPKYRMSGARRLLIRHLHVVPGAFHHQCLLPLLLSKVAKIVSPPRCMCGKLRNCAFAKKLYTMCPSTLMFVQTRHTIIHINVNSSCICSNYICVRTIQLVLWDTLYVYLDMRCWTTQACLLSTNHVGGVGRRVSV